MSYLDVPRLHFSGRFFTDPSTVNNDPTHYNPDVTNPSPWQEPEGQHRFQFQNCIINSAVNQDGPVPNDPVVGVAVNTNAVPDYARIVDLDVYQQGVSTLFGLIINIPVSDTLTISGNTDPAALNSCWFTAVLPTRSWGSDYGEDSFGGDMNACGFFQTVIRIAETSWPQSSGSALIDQLRASTITVDGQLLLSLKMVVDGYENVPQDANFRTGRIVGTIGTVNANEPLYNPPGRYLQPRSFYELDANGNVVIVNKNPVPLPWYYPSFNEAIFKVDTTRNVLVLDLANSICRQSAAGDPVDLGTITASVTLPDSSGPVAELPISTVDYSAFSYSNSALITELPLNSDQLNALQSGGALTLTSSRNDLGNPVVLSETGGIPSFAVEVRPVRMAGDPGTTATTQVYISQNGAPLAGKILGLNIASVHGDTPGATVPPYNPGDTPQADGALQATITPSDANGFATVTLTVVKDPGQRTPQLDGQLYFINLYDPELPEPDWATFNPIQEHLISCLVWSQYAVNTNPSWEEVQNMMAPYMKLYASMRNLVDLTDPHTFSIFAINPPWDRTYNAPPYKQNGLNIWCGAIPYYLTRDFNNSLYMPITRDLSPNKLTTVLYFVQNLQSTASLPPEQ